MARAWTAAVLGFGLAFGLAACGKDSNYQPVTSVRTGGTAVELSAPGGKLFSGENLVQVTFQTNGKPAEVQEASIRFYIPARENLPAMSAMAPLRPTDVAGLYRGRVDLATKGSWLTTVSFTDAAGEHRADFSIQAE